MASATFFSIWSFGTFFILRPKATFCSTVMLGKRLYCWKTMPMLRLDAGTLVTSRPSSTIWPSLTLSRPERQRSSVDLPQPEGPSSVTRSPCWMPKLMWSRTVLSPKRFTTSLNSM